MLRIHVNRCSAAPWWSSGESVYSVNRTVIYDFLFTVHRCSKPTYPEGTVRCLTAMLFLARDYSLFGLTRTCIKPSFPRTRLKYSSIEKT